MCQSCASLKSYSTECIFGGETTGAYTARETTNADIPSGNGTGISIGVGGSYVGELETAGDHDWIAIDLVAGQTYKIDLSGYGSSQVDDTYLRLYAPGSTSASGGTLVAYDDDSGPELNSSIVYTATSSGTYYIDVASWNDNYTGDYIVEADFYVPPDNSEVWTTQQIADQLTQGYWGGTQRSFVVGADNEITVDLTALNATYADFARRALQTWTDVIGVDFTEVSGSAEIEFTQEGSMEAWSSSSRQGSTLISSKVNIATNWLTSQGADYTLQTFIHEIGHALGLGHAGDYNGSADYGIDNLYANDSWQATVMSYFSQYENSYINASYAYLLTPMLADIVAIRDLYGTAGTTRTGDTVYGYNTNAGDRFDATVLDGSSTNYALTIVDDGGVDTLDLSGSAAGSRVDLTPGSISDVFGLIGNLTIGPDTVIENVSGSSGADWINGNTADNLLLGNNGNDTLIGGDGNDHLTGGSGADHHDGGNGFDTVDLSASNEAVNVDLVAGVGSGGDAEGDTYANINRILGSAYGDSFTGNGFFYGNGGDDTFQDGSGNSTYVGGTGDDLYVFKNGFGTNTIWGFGQNGEADKIDLSNVSGITGFGDLIANHAVQSGAHVVISDGLDTITLAYVQIGNLSASQFIFDTQGADGLTLIGDDSVEELEGADGSDYIEGNGGNDTLIGNGGDDILAGGDGNDVLIGGAGADYHNGGNGFDSIDFRNSNEAVNVDLAAGTGTGGDAEGDTYLNINRVYGSAFGDMFTGNGYFYGNGGNDTFHDGSGNSTYIGGAGDDVFVFEDDFGTNTIWGFGENGQADVIDLSSVTEITDFADLIANHASQSGAHVVIADGLNTITLANIQIGALEASDFAFVSYAVQTGDEDPNVLTGTIGADRLEGNGGDDTLIGDDGDDILIGGDGLDILIGGAGADHHDGGAGFDTVDLSASAEAVDVDLDAGVGSGGDAEGDTYVNINRVYGSAQGDTFTGNGYFFGNGGDDTFRDGSGNSVYIGGAGADLFVFENGFGTNTIWDFGVNGDDDLIDLSGVSEITDFDDLIANHATQVGAHVVISDGTDTLRIAYTQLGDLVSSDFEF